MNSKNFFKINAIYFTALVMVVCVFILGYSGIITNDFLSSTLIQLVTMLSIPMLLYTIFVSKDFKQTLADTGFKKISLTMLVISVLLGFMLYFLNSFVASFFSSILNILGFESINLNIGGAISASARVAYGDLFKDLILSCALPGLCEEFLHRGIMLNAGKKYTHPRFCLYISSLLFGLMHLNIEQFFYAAILGFLMGLVSLAAKSIYPTMIIHFMNNAISTYFSYGIQYGFKPAIIYQRFLVWLTHVPILYTLFSLLAISGIMLIFLWLLKQLKRQRAKMQIRAIVKNLNFENLPPEEMAQRIKQTNYIMQQAKGLSVINTNQKFKFKFVDNIFLISSLVLAGLITACSFVWGLL